jgi:hypothetical protein
VGILDGSVHPLSLAVCPRVIGLGELVGDGVLAADAIEGMQAILRRRTRAIARLVGEGDAVIGQDGVQPIGGKLRPRCAGTGRRRAWWRPELLTKDLGVVPFAVCKCLIPQCISGTRCEARDVCSSSHRQEASKTETDHECRRAPSPRARIAVIEALSALSWVVLIAQFMGLRAII